MTLLEEIVAKRCLRQLINDHSVNVNATNKNITTALKTACRKGNVDAISVLISSGALGILDVLSDHI